ncbi:MAG: helix-hairpin-helix domain-containing protein [Cyanobacteriota bacterium]
MIKKLLGLALTSVFALSSLSSPSFAESTPAKKDEKKMDKKMDKKVEAKKDDKKVDAKKLQAKKDDKKVDAKKMVAVNINTATEAQLKAIPGVGPVIAKAIVEYRTKNGKFKKIEDLKSIKGIGDKTFESMKKMLSL